MRFTTNAVFIIAMISILLLTFARITSAKNIDESKIAKASADIISISIAMFVFKTDTGQWPVMGVNCEPKATFLSGDGNPPDNLAGMGYDTGVSSSYNLHLAANGNGCYKDWEGPYIARINADPWGNMYVTNANGFSIKNRSVWIISAGPNGKIETPSHNARPVGDDIGLRIK